MKRPLFVFAGQSNMMGAAVYEASEQVCYENSFEYLHKARRFGADMGEFKSFGFPCGEFSYIDLKKAYGDDFDVSKKSTLDTYSLNTYFCPSMCNIESDENKSVYLFDYFSEANQKMGASLPPFIISELEKNGIFSAYTHIAKGAVAIEHYLKGDSEKYFYEKTRDFFEDCEKSFVGDDLSERIFVWMQGESDRQNGTEYYVNALEKLWAKLQKNGFTKFLIVRVPFWGDKDILSIMRAQEIFCEKNKDAYMLTRVSSFIPYKGIETESWQIMGDDEKFSFCRDSFYGFNNQHINEKGFKIIAKHAVPNIIRVLEGALPILEEERCKLC